MINVKFLLIALVIANFIFCKNVVASDSNKKLSLNEYLKIIKKGVVGNRDSLEYYVDKGLLQFPVSKDLNSHLLILNEAALVFQDVGSLDKATEYIDKSLALSVKYKKKREIAIAQSLKAVVYIRQSNFAVALKILLECLQTFENLKDKEQQAITYLRLANASVMLGKPSEGLKYINLAEEINRFLPKKELMALKLLNVKAYCLQSNNETNEAIAVLLEIYNKNSLEDFEVYNLKISACINLATIYYTLKDYDKSISYSLKGISGGEKYGFFDAVARGYHLLSVNYSDLKKFQKSNENAFLSLKNFKKIQYESDVEANLYEILASNYESLKDAENALLYLKKYVKLYKKLEAKRKETEFLEISKKYQLEKAEQEVVAVKEINQTRTLQRNLSFTLLIVALLTLIGSFYAVTRINFLRKQLLKHKISLENSNKLKDKVFSIIGHDLRGAFASSLGFFEMIKEELLTEKEIKSIANNLNTQFKYSLSVLDNLLVWGLRKVAGSKQSNVEFNLFDLVNANAQFLKENLDKKKITLNNFVEKEVVLFGEKNHYDFIIRNIISNAIKFSYENSKIDVFYASKSKTEFVITIKDYGVGMSENAIQQIYNGDLKSTYGTNHEKGTGLGLILCREFIEVNDGKLTILSKEKEGSTFCIAFNKKANS